MQVWQMVRFSVTQKDDSQSIFLVFSKVPAIRMLPTIEYFNKERFANVELEELFVDVMN